MGRWIQKKLQVNDFLIFGEICLEFTSFPSCIKLGGKIPRRGTTGSQALKEGDCPSRPHLTHDLNIIQLL